MRPALPVDQRPVAAQLAGRDSVLSVSPGDPQNRLHDQCHRIAEHESAQGHQDARRISVGRCRPESDVSGAEKPGQKMECRAGLERGPQPLRIGVGSSLPTPMRMTNNETLTKTFTQKN